MEKERQEQCAETAVHLFDFIVYNSVDFFENEMKKAQEQVGQLGDKDMEFELLILKSFVMDYIVSGEFGFRSLEKEVIVEVYYHHLEEFLSGATHQKLPLVQKRLKEYGDALSAPSEEPILVALAVQYARSVLREQTVNNYEIIASFAVYVINDLVKRIHNIIEPLLPQK